LPAIENSMRATVRSRLTNTWKGSKSRPVALARRWNCSKALRYAGVVTSSALTTTSAGVCEPGNARWMRW
jgi:hypothetical protein